MRIRHHPHTPAALLLGGIAALYALLGGGGGVPHGPPYRPGAQPDQRPLPAPGTNERKSLDWCRHNVGIIHDVYWASACAVLADEQRQRRAACTQAAASPSGAGDVACHAALEPPDDSPECTLPNERALLLNTARANAEQQCLDEALASGQHAGVSGAR